MQRIAIIGAGLCGLRCAEVLQTGGIEVQLFDKSRGVGGRLATRRHQHWRFDHGCPSLHGEQGEWQQLIDRYSAWYTARLRRHTTFAIFGHKPTGQGSRRIHACASGLLDRIRRADQRRLAAT